MQPDEVKRKYTLWDEARVKELYSDARIIAHTRVLCVVKARNNSLLARIKRWFKRLLGH